MKDFSIGVVPIYKSPDGAIYFLLVKHSEGHWALPKGHPETEEDEIATAKRELLEETGIDNVRIIPTAYFTEKYFYRDKSGILIDKTVKFFPGLCQKKEMTMVDGQEIVEAEWLDFNNAIEKITFNETKEVLVKAKEWFDTQNTI